MQYPPNPNRQTGPSRQQPLPAYGGYPPVEPPSGETIDLMELARQNPVVRPSQSAPPPRKRRRLACCSSVIIAPILVVCLLFAVYLLFPGRTNVLVLGIDARPDEGLLGRSDTNILVTFDPIKPYVGALSIPRDLWVTIPGRGENRINTAHFFAEADSEGSGPQGAVDAVQQNFGVDVDYYVRLRFTDFEAVVDAMGGIDVELPEARLDLPAGSHHLNGEKALALVRDRTTGGDDFSRMGNGQIFLRAVWKQMLRPSTWTRLPGILTATLQAVDTNIPLWQYPRLGLALLRVGPDEIDFRSINRDMVTGWTTPQGAAVLLPNWDAINPVLLEMFGQ